MVRFHHVLTSILFALCLSACGGGGGSGGGSGDSDSADDANSDAEVIGDTPVDGVIDSADGKEQLFAFAAPAAGVYNILLTWPNAGSDLDLFITDGDDSYFTLSANDTTESINIQLAAGGLLAIAVNAFVTAGAQTFTISAAVTTQPAHSPGHVESEPNDDPSINGNIIGFGQGSGIVSYDFASTSGADRDDGFVYVAPEAGTYRVLLTWPDSQYDLDMAIGWDSGTAASAQTNTDFEMLDQALNADEQLRVLVRAYDTGNAPVSYNLTIEAQ